MCLRRLVALNQGTFLGVLGIILIQALTNTAIAAPAQFLRLDDVKHFVSGGEINWDIRPAGSTEEKRLIPNGMINKDCLSYGNERATMKLVPHPNPKVTDQMILEVNLTSKCQKLEGNRIVAQPANDLQPNPDDAASLANTQALSSFFQGIRVPSEFSGKIMVCALSQGDKIEDRLKDNCSELSALDDNADGLVSGGNHIIGRGERVAAAEAAEKHKRELEAKATEDENAIKMIAIMRSFGRATCDGDITAAQSALSKLAVFGKGVVSLRRKLVTDAVANYKKEILAAKSDDDVEDVLTRIQSAENYLDDKVRDSLYAAAIDRKMKLLESRISDLTNADGSDTSSIASDINALRIQAKDLLGSGKDGKDKVAAVEALNEKLVTKAMALGNYSKAIELAKAGEQRTQGTRQSMRYALAERRVLEKEFQACVNKYADKDDSGAGLAKCQKIEKTALASQRNLEQIADGVGTDSEKEQFRDDRDTIFGKQSGCTSTPFGQVCQQGSLGDMASYQMKTLQDLYGDQMSSFGSGSNLASMMGLGGLGGIGGGYAGNNSLLNRFSYAGGGASQAYAGLATPYGNNSGGFPRNGYSNNQVAMF